MRFAFLFTLLSAVLAHDFSQCGNTDHLHVSSITLTPDSPVPGQPLTVAITGKTDESISSGKLTLAVKVFGVKITSIDFDLCTVTSCPVNGDYSGKITYTIPSEAPKGISATCELTAQDGSGNTLDCIDLKVTIGSGVSREVKSAVYYPPADAVTHFLDAVASDAPAKAPVCWKGTHTRGVGKIPSACTAPGTEKSGALCYPTCKDGFYGVGPVCWQHCPTGWVDEGALCRKDGSIETKAKQSYGRGVGTVMDCPAGEDKDAGLCYPTCPDGFYGVGPVCWESCPAVDPVSGGAVCCRDGTTCSDKIKELAGGLPLAVMHAILAASGDAKQIEEAVKEAIEATLGFIMPLCNTL